MLKEAHKSTGRAIYASVGALFGAHDLQKMDATGKLHRLSVSMTKHPDSFMPLKNTIEYEMNEQAKQIDDNPDTYQPIELFRGPVRDIAAIFPVNVNTMATAALAASNTLGFDKTVAVIVADARMDTMIIEIEMQGMPLADGTPGLVIQSKRENPSKRGEVTGKATLDSFYSSLLNAAQMGDRDGIHLA